MARWLQEMGVKTVAMESTGVYWVPVYEILEDHGMEVVLANARQARAVPGRKSDVSDAQWLQRLPAGDFTPVFAQAGRSRHCEPLCVCGNVTWNTLLLIFSLCKKH